jgi:alkanesulfonate monooxygenase SsuD/methylene tetrahydromethanopterin reductase-like flavin-dependent oxidoreductase (luciferase family)
LFAGKQTALAWHFLGSISFDRTKYLYPEEQFRQGQGMKVGLTYSISAPKDSTVVEGFRDTVEHVLLAEQLGYECALVSEHHFLKNDMLPSPLIAVSFLAAKTERIKLGTGLLLLPLHDPVRIAEDTAVVDVVSNGRLVLGLGQGFRLEEFDGFHRNEKDVTFEGEMFNYKNLNVTPKPLQKSPPIWIGAKMPGAIKVAADLGDVWYADPITPLHLIKERREGWLAALDENGKGRESASMAYYREFFVGPTTEAAWENGGNGIIKEYGGYLAMGHLVTHDGKLIPKDRKDLVPEIVRQRATVGDPQACVDDLLRIKEQLDLDHMILKMKYFGVPSENVKASMRLAAEKVLPKLN